MERERRRLVHRYIDGLASLPERREVERDIASDPALAAYVRAHQAVWAQVGAMPGSIANADSGAAIDAFAARISASDALRTIGASRRLQVVPVQPLRRRRTVDWSTIMVFGITAAAVAAIAIGGRGGHVGGAATGRLAGAQRVAPLTAIAARGARRTLRLPDGTDVVLGPASHIQYVSGADGSRTVSLAGEAMFRVVHRADRPFIVRVAGATLEDLGTVFVVRAYPGSPTRVSVEDGRVSLQAAATTMLDPGSSATLDSVGHPTVVHDPLDVGDAFAWTQGSLRYRAAPLADVAADLGRAYDLDIRLADPALGQRVVQYAIDGDDAHAALDVLVAALAGVGYERHGRVVILYRR